MTSEELQDAEIHVNRSSQQNSCKEEYNALTSNNVLSNKSKFMCFKSVSGDDWIVWSNTRLQYGEYLP